MSAQDFQSVLEAPDINASHEQLSRIIAHGVSADAASPTTAEAYLWAFCDSKSSFSRRRWVGITLCKMLQSSADVVAYLGRPNQGLTRLGEVILTTAEREETKIVAGLIIREALARGVKYLSFWPNDKVEKSVSDFPRDAGPRWMQDYQQFLQRLVDVAIIDRVNDCDLFYVVCLIASDGYKWKEPNDTASTLLIQHEHLTIVTADPTLQDIGFVDIPLSHIQSVHRKRAVLHDSQGQQTKLSPWDVVLKLRPGPWTYRVNSANHSGREFSIMFTSEEDAMECENSIIDLLRLPLMASTDLLSLDQLPGDEPEQDGATRAAQRGQRALADNGENVISADDNSALPEETRESTKPAVRLSVATDNSRIAPTTRRANTPRATVPQTVAVQSSTGLPPSESASNKSHAAVLAARNLHEPSVIGVQKQLILPKPGALPTVKKPTSSSVNTQRLPLGLRSDREFEFPEQTPRMKRPTMVTMKPSAKLNGTANASKKPANSVTKARPIGPKPKPKPKSRRHEVNNTEDEEDTLSQPSLRTQAPIPSPRSGAHNSVPKNQAASLNATVLPSNLPKIAKPKDAQTASLRHADSDVFAIPQDDETSSNLRAKRKRTKTVTYKEPETSEEEICDSEYTEDKRRRTRSPAKRSQPPKAPRLQRAAVPSEPKAKKSNRDLRPSSTEDQPMNLSKPSVLSQLVSKPQPIPSALPKKPKAHPETAVDGKENINPSEAHLGELSRLPETTLLGSETHILDKLNEPEGDNEHAVIVEQSSEHENVAVPRKRPAGSSPATPSRVKRAKMSSALVDRDADQEDIISVRPPSTNAPLRVLTEPSSPCRRQNQYPSTNVKGGSNRGMRAPAKPTVAPTTRTAPRSPRQRIVDSKKRLDRRHTPMHQYEKRSYSGGSVNVELLSSNSKPTPASPHAESTAISGHADPRRVNMEREMGKYEIERNDPFNHRPNSQKLTSFTRRLTGDEKAAFNEAEILEGASFELPIELGDSGSSSDTSSEVDYVPEPPKQTCEPALAPKAKPFGAGSLRVRQPARHSRSRTVGPSAPVAPRKARRSLDVFMDHSVQTGSLQPVEGTQMIEFAFPAGGVDMNGDTLVEQESEPLPKQKASPDYFKSSPPPLDGSPSSHSSTSAELEPRTDPLMPTSEAEEMEWEASLQPHQRSLHEQLLRVSTRVMRHVVDNETAVDSIADTYARDGKHMLDTLIERHNGEFTAMFKDVEKKRGKMKKASEQLLQKLAKDSEALGG